MNEKLSGVEVTITQYVDGVVTNTTSTREGASSAAEVDYKAEQFMTGVVGASNAMRQQAAADRKGKKAPPWEK